MQRDLVVIVALPSPDGGIVPPQLAPPDGITYHWANTTLMGEPDLGRLNGMLGDGWAFVPTEAHPEALTMTVGETIGAQAFCLLEKPSALVAEQRARERAPHMDLDIRVLGVLQRYTGKDHAATIGGQSLRLSITHRDKDGTVAKPLETLDEVRAELLKRFAEADVRLFMQRHFGV